MELSNMSVTELRRLQSKVEAEIRRRNDTARRDLLKRMQKMAADEGLSLSDILVAASANPEKSEPKRRAKNSAARASAGAPIKYRHPEIAGKGWSGRGRKPQWINDWIAQNRPIEELEVSAEA